MHPLISNVLYDVAGDQIRLADAHNVDTSEASCSASLETLEQHVRRGRDRSTRSALRETIHLGRQSIERRLGVRRS